MNALKRSSNEPMLRRQFCSSIRASRHVNVQLGRDPTQAMLATRDGGPLKGIGIGDRGSGLQYRLGRMAPTAMQSLKERAVGALANPRTGLWIVKAQAPLDNSSDAAGGIGRMTPATLLLHDEELFFVHFVPEGETGHSALLRATLRAPSQVAYLWAEHVHEPVRALKVYVETLPEGRFNW